VPKKESETWVNTEVMTTTDSPELRMIGLMRVILAIAALAVTWVDPYEPLRDVAATRVLLTAYVAYAAVLSYLARRRASQWPWAPFVDVLWCAFLLGVSGATQSVFFAFFMFAIISGALQGGARVGSLLTALSVGLLVGVTFTSVPVDWSRLALRGVFLAVFGYMVAPWGEFELTMRQRLPFLNELASVSNPRFGADHTIAQVMEQTRVFFAADSCIVVTHRPGRPYCKVRRAHQGDPRAAETAVEAPLDLYQPLVLLPPSASVSYKRAGSFGPIRWRSRVTPAFDDSAMHERCDYIASQLAARYFATASIVYRQAVIGRIYVTRATRPFRRGHPIVLRDATRQIVPYIESIRLVDQLAANAANAERERIGRDLHDTVVQSYIGLELGLRGVQNKLQRDVGPVNEIDRLIDLARAGSASVRDVVSGLTDGVRSRGPLAESLARYIETFQQVTGIAVHLTVAPELKLTGRVAGEVFHICLEGLSNIRRHTTATQAAVAISAMNGDVVVRIEDAGADEASGDFTPRSIDARVASLGGRVTVARGAPRGSIVTAEIPL